MLWLTWAGCSSDPTGAQLAAQHCQSCHLLPDPALLDKATWERHVLPQMGYRLGIYNGRTTPVTLLGGPDRERVLAENVFPFTPAMSADAWARLQAYYLSQAPDTLPAAAGDVIGTDTTRFDAEPLHLAANGSPPATTLVQFDNPTGRLFVGTVAPDGSRLWTWRDGRPTPPPLRLSSPVVGVAPWQGDTLLTLLVGQLPPHDLPQGVLLAYDTTANAARRVLGPLLRPVHMAWADLNGDGRPDAVVSNFGFRTGHLSWYEARPDGSYVPHLLNGRAGALQAVVDDVDHDGRPDLIALTAQGDEGICLYQNQGEGRFRRVTLLRFPPAWGSTGFAWIDFDGDGAPDILYTAGDNGDYPPVLKPYHGVRLFRNLGNLQFEEAFFLPQHGANRAVARDFDGDGDLDIASVSFFPDLTGRLEEGFLYFEQRAPGQFVTRTVPATTGGQWITLTAADVDQDGDEDLLLANFTDFNRGQPTPAHLAERWRAGPDVLLLRNRRAPAVSASE